MVDIARHMAEAERLITELDNPHHRAILENYRRHSLLELSERFEEILAPDMTVASPRYEINTPLGRTVYEGHEAVRDLFYGKMAENNGTFILKEQEHIAVGDWGFSQEQLVHYPMSGRAAAEAGFDVDDLDAIYADTRWVSMQWHYTPDALLIGEHVYRAPSHDFRKLSPEDFMTTEQVRAVLDPIIAAGRFRTG